MFRQTLQRIPAQVALSAYPINPIRTRPIRDTVQDALLVYVEDGEYMLRPHWGVSAAVLEEEDRVLNALNSFGARICKPFVRNSLREPVTIVDNVCWTMRHHSLYGRTQPSALANRDFFGKGAETVGEALANIHAAGWWYLHHTGHRLDQISIRQFPARLRSIAGTKVYSPEAIAQSVAGSADSYIRCVLPEHVDRYSGDFGYVINGAPRKPDRLGSLAHAKLEWSSRLTTGPITLGEFQEELDALIVAIENEEAWLDSPMTLLHGDLSSASLVVEHEGEVIQQVTGFKRLVVGSPVLDLGLAAVNFFTIWWDGEATGNERDYLPPQRLSDVTVFNRDAFSRFLTTYRQNMVYLISDNLPKTSFGAALESPSLLLNYMKLACFKLLCDNLETIASSEVERRCKKLVVMRLLHLLRILRQSATANA